MPPAEEIEDRVQGVRNVTIGEDDPEIRTPNSPGLCRWPCQGNTRT